MSLGEFELIERFFTRRRSRAVIGTGDDCAVIAPRAGMQLAVSSDMLVEGRHFLSTVDPTRLGHKALAVNLSDLAACGAQPLGFTLALALPRADAAWLEPFARGLLDLADEHDCELVGGDTTAGPLNICITVFGEVPAGGAVLRSGAHVGDDIYVSGTVGDARLALEAFRGTVSLPGQHFDAVRLAMETPQPRVALGLALRGVASAAIDVSDGLLGDLRHILRRSGLGGVGAVVDVDAVPRSAILAEQPEALQRLCTLNGGDDYELVFTAPPAAREAVHAAEATTGVVLTRIGHIDSTPGLRLVDAHGRPVPWDGQSFDHFNH
jgi:thiamine-monophosphate kinase